MRLAVGLFLAGLIAVLLTPNTMRAQATARPTYAMSILVQVRLEDGTPAPRGSLCELDLQNGEMIDQGEIDSSGRCRFSPTSHDIFLIRIKSPGYKEITERVDLQNAQTGSANIVLKAIPGQAPPAAPNGAGSSVSVAELSIPAPARKEYDLGQHALESHDLDGGITHLKKAIQLHDPYPQAYTLLGMAYNEQKNWKDAQSALEKAIQQDPKAAEAYVQLGSSLLQQKDYPGAEKALNQALQINPDASSAPMTHYNLATAYFSAGQWQDAEPHAAKTIAATPDFALAHWLMAQIMLKKGDGQGAIKEFQTYLKLDPNGQFAPSVHAVIPKIEAAMAKK